MRTDADRFFSLLDTDRDGVIGPEELVQYEWELAPDIQLSSKLKRRAGEPAAAPKPAAEKDQETRPWRRQEGEPDGAAGGLQGAARYGLLNMPEPVAAADADFDRAITRAEFEAAALTRFQLLDHAHRGVLTLDALDADWTSVLAKLHQKKHPGGEADTRVGVPLPADRQMGRPKRVGPAGYRHVARIQRHAAEVPAVAEHVGDRQLRRQHDDVHRGDVRHGPESPRVATDGREHEPEHRHLSGRPGRVYRQLLAWPYPVPVS